MRYCYGYFQHIRNNFVHIFVNFIHKNMNKNVNTINAVKKNIIEPVLHEMQDKSTAIFEGVSKLKDYQATMEIEKIQ